MKKAGPGARLLFLFVMFRVFRVFRVFRGDGFLVSRVQFALTFFKTNH